MMSTMVLFKQELRVSKFKTHSMLSISPLTFPASLGDSRSYYYGAIIPNPAKQN